MQRALLVANPSASGFTGSRYRSVSAALRDVFELETIWPETPDGSHKAAAAAAESGFDAVIAMGGDGVVHHVAAGLIHTDTALGIIPAGTTNVLSRILGIPLKPDRAAAAIGAATPTDLAAARMSWDSADGPRVRYALFSLGFGFDADVVDRAERRPHAKVRFGSLHYTRTAFATVVGDYRRRPASISVATGQHRVDAVALMIQIHHAYTYLGRIPLRLGPIGGGLLGLACNELGLGRALRILGGASARGRVSVPGCTVLRDVDTLSGFAEPEVLAQADGEPLGPVSGFSVSYESDALKVLAPDQELRAS